MKTLVIAILASWILYRAGVVHRFLNALIIPDLEPVPDHSETIRAAPDPFKELKDERTQLESEAAYILYNRGYRFPETVKTMSNDMLIRIIRDYNEL